MNNIIDVFLIIRGTMRMANKEMNFFGIVILIVSIKLVHLILTKIAHIFSFLFRNSKLYLLQILK
jgi:hypothetical protein